MMKLKRILLGASVAVLGLSLASCAEKDVRNTSTPYGNLKLDTEIATAGNLKLTAGQYYNKLRANGYSTIANEIDTKLYAKEISALRELYNGTSLSDNAKATLTIAKDSDKLYELNDAKINELRQNLLEQIHQVIATKVFGTANAKEIAKKSPEDLHKAKEAFKNSEKKNNNIIEDKDLEFLNPGDNGYTLPEYSKVIQFKDLSKFSEAIEAVLLEQAKLLSAEQALYQVAREEFIDKPVDENNPDKGTKQVKNDYFILKPKNYDNADISKKYENTYDSTYKTYGTYNAIVIQFNSLREAELAIANHPINTASIDTVTDSYLALYKDYYEFRGFDENNTAQDETDSQFIYKIDRYTNDFENMSASVAALVRDTLKDGEYLTTPRNINNKYVLALKLNTTYEYSDSDNNSLDYDKITDKKQINQKIEEDLILSNAKSYQPTDYQNKLKEAKLEIYDPYFEYKFEYANPTFYEHIDAISAEDIKTKPIFKLGDDAYTVEEFFADASDAYGSQIITEHFQLEYANLYYNDFVNEHRISDKARDDNKKALEDSIKQFNDGKNATYPKEIGLESFLLGTYGYTTEADVMKYYYDGKAALSTYKSIQVFDEWATDGEKPAINSQNVTILNNILDSVKNNNVYNDIFSINIDHILINIDDNGDGQPDDPKDFLLGLSEAEQNSFKDAVVALAQALYTEATDPRFKNNTLYETLKFLKSEYEEGAKLHSEAYKNKTWDDFKKYNFLLTVEQLASSGDITQDSVNNFVAPFKQYVIDMYKTASENSAIKDEYDNGIFYVVDYSDKNNVKGNEVTDKNQINIDSLCATNFGYHLIILNSYEQPGSTRYTKEEDDLSGFQSDLQIVLRKYKDDKDEKTIAIKTDSYNSEENAKYANLNQFFIYYVQKANGADSSLDPDIKKIMSSLYDAAITTYTSSNFQTLLLLKLLNIQIKDEAILGHQINKNAVSAEIESLTNQITSYDKDSIYASWCDNSYNWNRPNQKLEF